MLNLLSITSWVVHFEWMNKCRDSWKFIIIPMVLWKMHSYWNWEMSATWDSGFGLDSQKQTPEHGRDLETCWTRTRVLPSTTQTRLETCRTRTRTKPKLTAFLVKNDFLSDCQHGFVQGRSCTTQLLKITDKLTEILDKGGQLTRLGFWTHHSLN